MRKNLIYDTIIKNTAWRFKMAKEKRFEKVYPACGSNNSFIELTIEELEEYSKFVKWVKISKV